MKKTRIVAFLLTLCTMLPFGTQTFAEPVTTEQPEGNTVSSEDTIYMEDDSLTPPDISASTAALILDADSGRLIYGKNIDVKLFPASLTKIMTGILAIENGNMEDIVTIPYEAIATVNYLEDSNMGLLSDEQLTFEQLVSSMMIHSANDAANVIAFHLGGSIEKFAELMNNKAAELGMTNTHFVNACGTHDDNHYTTARDMATLAQYAMKNEKFREIVKTTIYKIAPTNKYTIGERIMVNTNLFLSTSRSLYQYYPAATGIKTGHTSQAGYCLVSSASYNDSNLIAVSLKNDKFDSHGDPMTYSDSHSLFEFAFSNYEHAQLAAPGDIISDSKVYEAKNDARIALTVEENVSALIPANTDSSSEIITNIDIPERIPAPVKKGDTIGTVTYTYNGTQIGTANLISTNDVELNYFLHVFHIIINVLTSPLFLIPVILLLIIAAYAKHLKKKRERKRRIQQLRKKREGQNRETGRYSPDRKTERMAQQRHNTKDSNSRYRK